MKRLIIDIDDTISFKLGKTYASATCVLSVKRKLEEYRELGFCIVLYSSRNMQTFSSNVGKINAVTLPMLVKWLNENEVPYDEIYMGKPWCGLDGFYVDDKAVRPYEFATMTYSEICRTLTQSATQLRKLEEEIH